MKRKRILTILIILAAFCFIGGCAKQPPQPASETRFLLDTVCTITVYGGADASLPGKALDLCAEYEGLLSRTVEGSDIWRINHAGGEPVTVDPRTAELVEDALEFGDFSGGMFDITIGRLCALWDFNGNPSVPPQADLKEALSTVGYKKVIVKDDTVRMLDPEAWLDLGGIAKGYIADKAAAFLKENGVTSAIVDLGGNIVTVGTKPDGSLWHIGIKQPFDGGSKIIGALTIGEASIVTSGIYERQFIQDGVLYHHILDPNTGEPVRNAMVSATIVTESSTVGDALTTILILAGSKGAPDVLARVPGYYGAVLMLDSGEIQKFGDIDFSETTP